MATYGEIQEYVKNKYGYTVKTCWIAHAKEILGMPLKAANNRISPDSRKHPCPENKLEAIKEAFIHFDML